MFTTLSKVSIALALSSTLALAGCSGGHSSQTSWQSNNPRLLIENRPLDLTNSSSGEVVSQGLLPTFSLTLSATLSPPVLNGTTLQANDISMSLTKAYVAYNVAGATQAGAMDTVNLVNALLPSVLSEATFSNMDVNHVYVSGLNAYVVGATSDNSVSSPAQIRSMNVGLLTGVVMPVTTNYTLPSYAGTSLVGGASALYATSGDGGGLTTLNPTTLATTNYNAIFDARDVAVSPSTGSVYVVAGQPGRIVAHDALGNQTASYALGGATIAESKSTIRAGQTLLVATVGDGGTRVVCQANGQVLASIPAPTVSGLPAAKTVSNAAATAPGLLFVANGEAGVYVYSMKSGATVGSTNCKAVTTSLLGTINFGTAISANNIYYSGGFLFVASGTGGLKIITVVSLGGSGDTTDFN